jgi:hypothetical protein
MADSQKGKAWPIADATLTNQVRQLQLFCVHLLLTAVKCTDSGFGSASIAV